MRNPDEESPFSKQRCKFIEVETWQQLCEEFRSKGNAGTPLFRGQRECWRLWSSFERHLYNTSVDNENLHSRKDDELYRQSFMTRFVQTLATTPVGGEIANADELEKWAIGRHHGLITPLLDWTRSPYIATYFAFVDAMKHCGFWIPTLNDDVLEFDTTRNGDQVFIYMIAIPDGYTHEGLEFVQAITVDLPRQAAQRGCYSILRDSSFIDIESFLSERGSLDWLTCYAVPLRIYPEVLCDLNLMNITASSLYPGFDGAADYANFGWRFTQSFRFDYKPKDGEGHYHLAMVKKPAEEEQSKG